MVNLRHFALQCAPSALARSSLPARSRPRSGGGHRRGPVAPILAHPPTERVWARRSEPINGDVVACCATNGRRDPNLSTLSLEADARQRKPWRGRGERQPTGRLNALHQRDLRAALTLDFVVVAHEHAGVDLELLGSLEGEERDPDHVLEDLNGEAVGEEEKESPHDAAGQEVEAVAEDGGGETHAQGSANEGPSLETRVGGLGA